MQLAAKKSRRVPFLIILEAEKSLLSLCRSFTLLRTCQSVTRRPAVAAGRHFLSG